MVGGIMKVVGAIGAVWGAGGVFLLLLSAVFRLAPKAWDAFEIGLTPGQWVLLVVVIVFMAYSEGYKGFQKKFSPRTAARVRHLVDHPKWLHTILAPFFCMGFFHATRRTKIVAWVLPLAIITLVVLVHRLDQPWRGIIDAGVVLGLAWGVVSLAVFIARAFSPAGLDASPEVPGPNPA